MANINVYPRNGTDMTNFFSDICPTCGKIHHLYGINPFICYANGYNNAVGYTPVVVASDLPSGDFSCVVYGSSLYAAVGANCAASSADGTTWALRSIPKGKWQCVTYKASLYLAVGYDDFYNGIMASSADGTAAYALVSLPSGTGSLMDCVWNASNLFVAVGTNTCLTSADGATWTKRTIPAGNWTAVQYNGSSLYMAIDTSGKVATSADGTTWALATSTPAAVNELCWGAQVSGAAAFVAVGNGVCYTSPDGTTWTSRAIGTGNWVAVISDGTNLVATGNGKCATSTDAVTWTAQAGLGAGNWTDVANNGSTLYVAIGTAVACASSTDRAVWTARTVACGMEVLRAGKVMET